MEIQAISLKEEEKEVADYQSQVSLVETLAKGLEIKSEVEMLTATDILGDVKRVEKAIKERKQLVTKPLMEGLASARELFKPLEKGYANAEKIIKAKMLDYTNAESERVLAEKQKLADGVASGEIDVNDAVTAISEVGTSKSSFEGAKSGTSIRTVMKVRVYKEELIPREYLVPDLKAISDAILKKNMYVPGAEKYEEKSIVSRSV